MSDSLIVPRSSLRKSRSRTFSFQRVEISLASASQFQSRGSSSSARFSSMASINWPSAIRRASSLASREADS